MSESVKPRRYRSSVREEQARRTRLAILDAARLLFTDQGYAATTIAQIAAAARVAVDTVYASVGTKPVLVRLLVETAISGGPGRGARLRPADSRGRHGRAEDPHLRGRGHRGELPARAAAPRAARRRRAGAGTWPDVDRDRYPPGGVVDIRDELEVTG
jgi:AcrR family transcriptional regulator